MTEILFDFANKNRGTSAVAVTENANITAQIHPVHMLWPIPQSVITANTLGVINQNVGYNGDDRNVPPLETIE